MNFNETVSAPSSLPQKFRFLAQRPLPRDSVRVCVRLLHRKAEHLVLSGPFRRQVGEASDADAMRERAIDGGCSELATDNRLVGSSSPLSPTTQSHTNRDFRVSCKQRRIGLFIAGLPDIIYPVFAGDVLRASRQRCLFAIGAPARRMAHWAVRTRRTRSLPTELSSRRCRKFIDSESRLCTMSCIEAWENV